MKTKSIVKTVSLCKKYGRAMRVKNLDMEVPEGAVYGFLGPNGAGKSTTLKMILGLARPTVGEIFVFGKRMNQANRLPILKEVGSLIESPSYYGHLTGEENLRMMQKLLDVPNRNVEEVLQIVRLEGQRHKKVGQYSLGMKQRLGIACALLAFPKLLILDEPTNGLDPAGIQEMRELIVSLPERYGMTVVVSSHLLGEIDQMADSLGIIHQGGMIFQGNLTELHSRSKEQLAIRTSDNRTVMQLFAEQRIPCKEEDAFLILPRMADELVARCNQFLVMKRINVVRIEERKKSLEDLFLELTGTEASL